MKKCPRCELNYIKEEDELCRVCRETILRANAKNKAHKRNLKPSSTSKQKAEYNQRTMVQNEVAVGKISTRVTASEVFQSVRYLTYGYGEYSIYNTGNSRSYRNITNKLKLTFHYAKIPYPDKTGFAYIFEANEIWERYFLADKGLKSIIDYRRIEAIDELIAKAYAWHSVPYKLRKIKL